MIRAMGVFFAIITLASLQSCMFFYKVQIITKVTSHEIKQYDSLKKYIILHQRDTAWHLLITEYSDDLFYGEISVLPNSHMKYKTTNPKGGNRYIKGDKNIKSKKPIEIAVLDEVHLYLNDSLIYLLYDSNFIKVNYSAISKAEIYNKAKGRTILSWIIPIAGGTLLIGGIIITIVIASQSMWSSFTL